MPFLQYPSFVEECKLIVWRIQRLLKMFFVIIWYSSSPIARFSIPAVRPITVCRSILLRASFRRSSSGDLQRPHRHPYRMCYELWRGNTQNSLKIDFDVVETMANFKTTHHFNHDVHFIIDIRGQDVKCFKV